MKNYFTFFVCIVLVSLLNACVPAALVIGATAGGAIVYDNRDFKTIARDKNAQITLADALATDPTLKGQTHISATVLNQVALLVGQAPTQELKDRAYQLASSVRNIRRIYNEITIENSISIAQQSQDTWITTKIKTRLLGTKNLHSSAIKVVTENGVVYLMGVVTQSQGNLAASVVSEIAGVKRIVKVFQYSV